MAALLFCIQKNNVLVKKLHIFPRFITICTYHCKFVKKAGLMSLQSHNFGRPLKSLLLIYTELTEIASVC